MRAGAGDYWYPRIKAVPIPSAGGRVDCVFNPHSSVGGACTNEATRQFVADGDDGGLFATVRVTVAIPFCHEAACHNGARSLWCRKYEEDVRVAFAHEKKAV